MISNLSAHKAAYQRNTKVIFGQKNNNDVIKPYEPVLNCPSVNKQIETHRIQLSIKSGCQKIGKHSIEHSFVLYFSTVILIQLTVCFVIFSNTSKLNRAFP